ncbi:MAG: glycosyl hydrolase family 43 [Clostridia bacterium]|nr:glycosyl hydrolase family 43 [Clostridia bacterium]
MINLTFNDIMNADFKLYDGNPIIKNPPSSFVIADPSVITPAESHDGKWHLFCHTFFGVRHYEGDNGIDFTFKGRIVNRAMRPNINYIDGKYYLFYERTKPVLLNLLALAGFEWKSEIYCTESTDLQSWTEPYPVITQSRYYEKDSHGTALSNPFLIKERNRYRMYYSCGQTFIKDCGFCEPTHVSFAESDHVNKGYTSLPEPIISPDKDNPYLNLCSGCLKVYRLKDCYIGLQNGIFERDGKSYSAIMLLRSDDGVKFEFAKQFLTPQVHNGSKWMAQYVYACCLTCHDNKLRLYFNARNTANNVTGRESIGIFEATI